MVRLDLRVVEYFVAVAEELHFGRAAERLHIAQPSLSQQIRRLEAQLGVRLLERTSRHVELTAAGHTLLREGRRLLAHAERTLEAVRDAASERLVVTRLAPGEAELEIEILLQEPRVVVLPAAHPLAGRTSLRYAALRDEPFITQPRSQNPEWRAQWLAEQRRHGLPGMISAEATSVQEILTLVASGRGVCIVPAQAARLYPRSDVTYVTIEDADPAIVSLAWTADRVRPAIERFIAIAREGAEGYSPRSPISTPNSSRSPVSCASSSSGVSR
jgi:DNA-binding transcriptional LysR family regulator